jgi:hypothetical protein
MTTGPQPQPSSAPQPQINTDIPIVMCSGLSSEAKQRIQDALVEALQTELTKEGVAVARGAHSSFTNCV